MARGNRRLVRTRFGSRAVLLDAGQPPSDDQKCYWLGADEIEQLLRHGEGWLPSHPARRRYLKDQKRLTRLVLEQLERPMIRCLKLRKK
jgi:RNA repair, ligase-Pnkp-associating, region of Hen1